MNSRARTCVWMLEVAIINMRFVGDIILDEPNPDFFLDRIRPHLAQCDLLVGHVEVPHTTRGEERDFDVPAPPANPENLKALSRSGFHVATLAGNHISDHGANGIADTRAALADGGILTTGAGRNLQQALEPAIVDRDGVRVGVLSFNCVGPRESWASETKAGCAYVHILTHYELEMANPGGPPKIYTFADPDSLDAMKSHIAAVRRSVDVLAVALHKGIVHRPTTLAMYERPVAHAAVDAGADIVVGHHAHILRGIEVYHGKPIYHGLGNFVVATRALSDGNSDNAARRAWVRRRKEVFGFVPDPDYPLYPFHPEAKNLMIADCHLRDDGTIDAGFIPAWMHPSAQPELLDPVSGAEVVRYVERISTDAGLAPRLSRDGVRVAIR